MEIETEDSARDKTPKPQRREGFQYIGELPVGYEYKLFAVEGQVRILAVHQQKTPRGFVIDDDKLIEMDIGANR